LQPEAGAPAGAPDPVRLHILPCFFFSSTHQIIPPLAPNRCLRTKSRRIRPLNHRSSAPNRPKSTSADPSAGASLRPGAGAPAHPATDSYYPTSVGPCWSPPVAIGGFASSWFTPRNIEDSDLESWCESLIAYPSTVSLLVATLCLHISDLCMLWRCCAFV
jgi:hypothetical protein